MLVLGDFGRGKTFALRELARRIPARLPHLIPHYIELRALDKAHSVDGLVAAHLANHGEDLIDLKAFRYMLAQGRIVLLFDGFDELVTRVTYERAADHLQTLLCRRRGQGEDRRRQPDAALQVAGTGVDRARRAGRALPGRRVLGIEDFTPSRSAPTLCTATASSRARRPAAAAHRRHRGPARPAGNPRMLGFIAALDAERLRAVAGAGRALSAPPGCMRRSCGPGSATSTSARRGRPARQPGISSTTCGGASPRWRCGSEEPGRRSSGSTS